MKSALDRENLRGASSESPFVGSLVVAERGTAVLPSVGLLAPVLPESGIGVGRLVVENEHTAGLEMLVEAAQSLEVLVAIPSEAEASADENRLVPAGEIELVHRLRIQMRRESFHARPLATEGQHVRRDVTPCGVG